MTEVLNGSFRLRSAGLSWTPAETEVIVEIQVDIQVRERGYDALFLRALATQPTPSAVSGRCGHSFFGLRGPVARALGGSCTIPLGAYAEIAGGRMRLRALVASPDGRHTVRAEGEGGMQAAEALGLRVAALLRERGAGEILAALAP